MSEDDQPPRVPPIVADHLGDATARALLDGIRRAIGPVALNQEHLADIALRAEQYYADVIRPGLAALRDILETYEHCLPPNWRDLEHGELGDAAKMVNESRICIVWAPRVEIVRAMLVAGGEEAQLTVLVDSRDAVLDDAAAVVADARGVPAAGHSDACEFAAEAIAAVRDGHAHAAQALAASGLGQVIHGALGYPLMFGLGRAFKQFSSTELERTTMRLMKADLIELCTASALTDIDKIERGGFNRHATQHGQRAFFSEANALAGILLLTAWVRELRWLSDNFDGVFEEADAEGDEQ